MRWETGFNYCPERRDFGNRYRAGRYWWSPECNRLVIAMGADAREGSFVLIGANVETETALENAGQMAFSTLEEAQRVAELFVQHESVFLAAIRQCEA